jgi:hypothetical protein
LANHSSVGTSFPLPSTPPATKISSFDNRSTVGRLRARASDPSMKKSATP